MRITGQSGSLDRRQVIASAIAVSLAAASAAHASPRNPSPQKETAMPASPLDVVKTLLTTLMNKDYDAGVKYVSADCEYTNIPMATVKGPAGVRAVLEPFFAPTIRNEFTVLREAVAGPVVFLERLDRHLLATGWVELPVAGVFEVHDGLVTVWRDYFDAATIVSKWPAAPA